MTEGVEAGRRLPLSAGQESLWVQHRTAPESAAYNVLFAVRVRSAIDVGALSRAVRGAAGRHPLLRSVFGEDDGVPYRLERSPDLLEFDVHDVRDKGIEEIREIARLHGARPFRLDAEAPCRVALFRRTPQDAVLLVAAHHIVTDFFSQGVLMEQLLDDHGQLSARGALAPRPEAGASYEDHVAAERAFLESCRGKESEAFWRDYCAGAPTVLELPTDRPRPGQHGFTGHMHQAELPRPLFDRMREAARESGVTPFVYLLTVFQSLMARESGQPDLLVGSPVSTRTGRRTREVVGYFVNSVVLRARFGATTTFRDALRSASGRTRAAMTHLRYPFALLSRLDEGPRAPGRPPLVQVAFGMQAADRLGDLHDMYAAGEFGDAELRRGGLRVTAFEVPQQGGHFDLLVNVFQSRGPVRLVFFYNTDLFDLASIVRLRESFVALLESVLADPDQPVMPAAGAREPRPARSAGRDARPAAVARPPADGETADRVLRLWREVLRIRHADLEDDFFAAGGYSLLATRLVSRVREAFGVEVSLAAFLDRPTPGALLEAVQDASTGDDPHLPIPRSPAGESAPASPGQRGLWFLERLMDGLPTYNSPILLKVTGRPDTAAIAESLLLLAARHEALRTRFALVDGELVQTVSSTPELPLRRHDLRTIERPRRSAEADEIVAARAARPFPLESGPLVRADLVTLDDEDHLLLITMHHGIADGWSIDILLRELLTGYERLVAGDTPEPGEPPLRYADFARWQRERLNGPAVREQLRYWRHKLADAPAVLALPADRPRPAVKSYRGAATCFRIPAPLADALRALGRRERATPFMTLLAAFECLLHLHTRERDIAVGTPIANRTRPETEDTVGFFANTIVLRTEISGDRTFLEVLDAVRETALEAYDRQDVPFERLVEELGLDRDPSRTPLFQVMFIMQDIPLGERRAGGMTVAPILWDTGTSKFDLLVSLHEDAAGFAGYVEYSTDLFERERVVRLVEDYVALLDRAVASPEVPVAALRPPGPARWTGGPRAAPTERDVGGLALVCDGTETARAEFAARTDRAARRLAARGAPVGVVAERRPGTLVAIAAALKSGTPYVLLDPALPEVTRAEIRKECGAEPDDLEGAAPRRAAVEGGAPWSPACVLYPGRLAEPGTGAVMTRGDLLAVGEGLRRELGLGAGDTVVLTADPAEAVFTAVAVAALMAGCRLVLLPPSAMADVAGVIETAGGADRTFVQADFAAWGSAARSGWKGDRRLRGVCTGEVTSFRAMAAFGELAGEMWYVDGSAGTAGLSLCVRGSEAAALGAVPARRPVGGSGLYVLDEYLRPAPVGVPGDLHVAGRGVARPLAGDPRPAVGGLPSQAGPSTAGTGYLARYRPDGTIDVLGRARRFTGRLPLWDAEAVLAEHPGVRDALVCAGTAGPVACVVPASERHRTFERTEGEWHRRDDGGFRADLVEHARRRLAGPLVPVAVVALAEVPRRPDGAVDHALVSDLAEDAAAAGEKGPVVSADEDAAMRRIWGEVLGLDWRKIAPDDNFFELGGHSVLAALLISEASRAFSTDIPLKVLFQNPTPASMAGAVARLREDPPNR